MKTTVSLLLLSLASLSAGCRSQPVSAPAASELKTEEQKAVYALGALFARNVSALHLTPAEIELVQKGFGDIALGKKPQVELEQYGPKIQELAKARAAQAAVAEKTRAKAFQETAAKEAGAVKTPSGLVSVTLKPGSGASPAATDTVKVHYEGKLVDGTVFDSSVQRGQPAEFRLNGVIPCWTEGVQRMKVGEKARLVCPSEIAYGDGGKPPQIPGGATLVFEVELLEIKK